MPDGADGGLRERVPECERSGPTERRHRRVHDGLILNVLIVERILNDGHEGRQRGSGGS